MDDLSSIKRGKAAWSFSYAVINYVRCVLNDWHFIKISWHTVYSKLQFFDTIIKLFIDPSLDNFMQLKSFH